MKNVTNLQRKTFPQPVELICGVVIAEAEGQYHVLMEYGTVIVSKKAAGCLIVPETGDRVLVAFEGGKTAFILNILAKSKENTRIALPGKVVIEGEEITLRGDKSTSIEAPEVKLSGIHGEASFAGFSFMASWCETRVKKAVFVARALDAIIDSTTEKVRNSFRYIEEMEQTTAKRIRTIVKERFFLKAKHASVIAEEEVTIDGNKIHIG